MAFSWHPKQRYQALKSTSWYHLAVQLRGMSPRPGLPNTVSHGLVKGISVSPILHLGLTSTDGVLWVLPSLRSTASWHACIARKNTPDRADPKSEPYNVVLPCPRTTTLYSLHIKIQTTTTIMCHCCDAYNPAKRPRAIEQRREYGM
jgi:hypothetical protein